MPTWIELDGLDNMRDLGGLRTADGGEVQRGRLLRSDNLQDLTDADIDAIADAGVTDVVDLRSRTERGSTGPGRLDGRDGTTVHAHSFFVEEGDDEDFETDDALPGEALPWDQGEAIELDDVVASSYARMFVNRPDTAVAALRVIAQAPGGTLVHCAAGKDRTGIVCALALELAGVPREDVVADYVATAERVDRVVARMARTATYGDSLRDAKPGEHAPRAETMTGFLAWIDGLGGPAVALASAGWTDADTAALRAKLLRP